VEGRVKSRIDGKIKNIFRNQSIDPSKGLELANN
jgi:hypothetical protein